MHSPTPHETYVQDTRAMVEDCWRRTYGMDAQKRRRAIEICLAYQFRAMGSEDALQTLRAVAMRPRQAVMQRESRVSISQSAIGGWEELLECVLGAEAYHEATRDGEKRIAATQRIRGLTSRMEKVTGGSQQAPPLLEAVETALGWLDAIAPAMKQASNEFAGLLLETLDPRGEIVESSPKGLAPSFYRKSANYDALCEKYDQVRQYHDSGRLGRDLRSMFRKHMREEQEK